jgi:hypothetical protein
MVFVMLLYLARTRIFASIALVMLDVADPCLNAERSINMLHAAASQEPKVLE